MNRSSPGRGVGREGIPRSLDGSCIDIEAWKCKGLCEEQERLGVGKTEDNERGLE